MQKDSVARDIKEKPDGNKIVVWMKERNPVTVLEDRVSILVKAKTAGMIN